MTELSIGTGGWAYFQVPRLSSLEAYAMTFNFVEVNSTFYKIPPIQLVRSWRRRVPQNFEFSVRCHRDLTHRWLLEPIPEAFSVFKTMIAICKLLHSSFIVFITPPSLNFSSQKVESIRDFFGSLNLKGIRMVWEVRRRMGEFVPSDIIFLMQEYNIIHCVDLSREKPVMDSNTVYTRVFGKGKHNIYQFADEELLELDSRIAINDVDKAVISFHNVRMYKDAARYKVYKQTKTFPPVTRAKGFQSLREVLMEDAEFPASKQKLIQDQGWKVIDLTDEKRVHAYTLLEKLPNRNFRNIEEIMVNLPLNLSNQW